MHVCAVLESVADISAVEVGACVALARELFSEGEFIDEDKTLLDLRPEDAADSGFETEPLLETDAEDFELEPPVGSGFTIEPLPETDVKDVWPLERTVELVL